MFIKIRNAQILSLLLLVFLQACVGTVEETKQEKTNFSDPKKEEFKYQGIVDARAIAHDKIEIDFLPAGDPEKINHYLQVNGTSNPIELQLSTVPRVDGGVYRYLLTGLKINTPYSLKIFAENPALGSISTGEKVYENIYTFDSRTADFKGITSVTPIPGKASSAAYIKWNPATFESGLQASAYDPVYYEISRISQVGGFKNLNNKDYSGTDRIVKKVPGTGSITASNHKTYDVMEDLLPNTTYYFQVRAVHKVWRDQYVADPNNITVDRELNSIYIKYKTAPLSSFVDFDKDTLNLDNTDGESAFDTISVNWEHGEGTFYGYKLFITEYTGSDYVNDDELPQVDLVAGTSLLSCVDVPFIEGIIEAKMPVDDPSYDSTKIACFTLPTTVNSFRITDLPEYKGYHAKLALCRDATCSVDNNDPNAAILGNIARIQTVPELAPFHGINFLVQPQDPDPPSELEKISMEFTAPDTEAGYADEIEVYCVDPDNYNNRVKFPTDPPPNNEITASGIALCDGLSAELVNGDQLEPYITNLTAGNVNKLVIRGTENKSESLGYLPYYCFAVTPAITERVDPGFGEYRLAVNEQVVRCIAPEVAVPTAEEFPGLKASCAINEDELTLSWDSPTSGIYNDFVIFQKKKNAYTFNFGNAKAGDAEYTAISGIAPSATSHVITGLTPGEAYEFGILAAVTGGSETYYSEPNLKIVECTLPLPVATFEEWTRVFAIGPKIDGRIPTFQDATDNNPWPRIDDSAYIYEALDLHGVPYEVTDIDSVGTYYSYPPGDSSVAFSVSSNETFDGKLNADSRAASNQGIVSLAWKDVELDYLDTEFKTTQNTQVGSGGLRSTRDVGYRVYRSDDNGLNWLNLTGTTLINAIPFTYDVRRGVSSTVQRIAFFTDYSVIAAKDFRDIARAREYMYKIVPVYQGKELSYNDNSFQPDNVVKVTLPPPNMALVKREMANRSACLEIDKEDEIEKKNFYVCPWNGLGTRPRSIPWQLSTEGGVVDLGADLLVDRFELGCNFTRGDRTVSDEAAIQSGASFFEDAVISASNDKALTEYSEFKGLASGSGEPFRGCGQLRNFNGVGDFDNPNYYLYSNSAADPYGIGGATATPSYNQMLYGDCFGSGSSIMPSQEQTGVNVAVINFIAPGLRDGRPQIGPNAYDPLVQDNVLPHFAFGDGVTTVGYLDPDLRRSRLAIGEFAAVFFNSYSGGGNRVIPIGPGADEDDNGVNVLQATSGQSITNCSINLASMGADGNYRSRWFPIEDAVSVNTKLNSEIGPGESIYEDITGMQLSEVIAKKALYDDTKVGIRNFMAVSQSLWNSDRIAPDMTVGRVAISNNAKLPRPSKISGKQYQKICNQFKVQVGIQSESTGFFSANTAPQKKQMLRRTEYLMATKFPETYSENTIEKLETTGTLNTGELLPGKLGRTCMRNSSPFHASSSRTTGGAYTTRGAIPGGSQNILTTGSSAADSTYNTESCVTKYGIQDLIGNGYEYTADKIFCDYNSNSMGIYYGRVDAGNIGIKEWSVTYPFNDLRFADYASLYGVAENAPIRYPGLTLADVPPEDVANFRDYTDGAETGVERYLNNKMWQHVSVDSGYCSIVDNISSRTATPANYRTGTIFNSLLNPNGTVNTSTVVTPNAVDSKAADWMRNGDGYFLNFGETNIAPSLKLSSSLSFESTLIDLGEERMIAKYFNPLIGMPLMCKGYNGAGDACDEMITGDNLNYTLDTYWVNHPPFDGTEPTGIKITDFPVGKAEGISTGIAAIGIGDATGNIITNNFTANTDYSNQIINQFKVELDDTVTYTSDTFYNLPADELNVRFYNMMWAIPRGAALDILTGATGRYNFNIERSNDNIGVDPYAAGRCAVRINEGY